MKICENHGQPSTLRVFSRFSDKYGPGKKVFFLSSGNPIEIPRRVRAPQHEVGRFAESQQGDLDALPGIMAAISSVSIMG